jgi:hypothetical protein
MAERDPDACEGDDGGGSRGDDSGDSESDDVAESPDVKLDDAAADAGDGDSIPAAVDRRC